MNKPKVRPAPLRAASTVNPAAEPAEREARGARRKRETREKLIEAAFRLMAERGMDAVAINEITEAADVGFGSFYNHFESREAIYAAVIDAVFEEFADALEHLVSGIEDPAEIIAVCVRHTILRARREPLWGHLLVREGLSMRGFSRGLGARLLRDIQKGIAKKRLITPDVEMSFVTVGAGALGAIAVAAQADNPALVMLTGPESDIGAFAERSAAMLLSHLGLPFAEAKRISRRPLPAVDRPVSPG